MELFRIIGAFFFHSWEKKYGAGDDVKVAVVPSKVL